MKHTRQQGIRQKVLLALDTGRCNTSLDVAEETGLSKRQAIVAIHHLADDGIVKITNRIIKLGQNHRCRVFEVVA